MGLIILSIVLSILTGCIAWLVLGEKFPLNGEAKWPASNNILCYALIVFLPFYLSIFFSH